MHRPNHSSPRSLLLTAALLSAALAVAPSEANAGCLANSYLVDCEYPPFTDDFGPVTSLNGADTGRPPGPTDPASDVLYRVTIAQSSPAEPGARCNDGSPAIMYVRQAPSAADDDKWLIVLEGGGSGFDPRTGDLDQGMWERWTGLAGSPLDWYRKASTDWWDASAGALGRDGIVDAPEELVINGIFDSTASSFADWNWVFINYCSSDLWTGQVSDFELPYAGSWTDGGVLKEGFKMDFNGHKIIAHALDMLRRQTPWAADIDPDYTLPSIDGATTVLFAGESAGGAGVAYNLDFVYDFLSTYNPSVDLFGSIGAYLKPTPGPGTVWYVDNVDGTGASPGNFVDDNIDGAINVLDQVIDINGFIDQSCLANLGDWRCIPTDSLLPEISTPVFVKQDMGDSVVGTPYDTMAKFALGLRAQFINLASMGVPHFGPFCNHHSSLTSAPYFDHVLEKQGWTGAAPNGIVYGSESYDDALWHFVNFGLVDPYAFHSKVFGGGSYVWVSDC